MLMAKNSNDYWAKRAVEYEAAWHDRCQKTVEKELADYYERALARIEKDIAVLFGRYAKDNQVTYAEAVKLLTGNEYKHWKKDIEDYIKEIDATNDKGLLKELNTLAMRSRISRLDSLYADTLKSLDKLGRQAHDSMNDFLSEAYKDRYYHGLFDAGQQKGSMPVPTRVDDDKVAKVVNAPWSGKNYSKRLWKNQELLSKTLKETMASGIHRGLPVNKMAEMVESKMHAGLSNAKRLVQTEMNYVQNQAALDGIKDAGMAYFQFIATLDQRTTPMCREHDGKIYPVEEGVPGDSMPPLHPRCRSTIAGSLGVKGKGKRIARDASGNNIHVPASMTYQEWEGLYLGNAKEFASSETEMQFYRSVKLDKNDVQTFSRASLTITGLRVENAYNTIYVSNNIVLKPKQLHQIDSSISKAFRIINPPNDYVTPTFAIVGEGETINNAPASYNYISNVVFIYQGFGNVKEVPSLQKGLTLPNSELSSYVHELSHWMTAQKYKKLYGEINSQYIPWVRKMAKKKIDSLLKKGYNVNEISNYAAKHFIKGNFDEVYAEFETMRLLKGNLK